MSATTAPAASELTLRIGELAELAGVTTRTLRYWEQLELIEPSGRRSGERFYSVEAVERVARIRDLQCLLGLSLAEIRAVLDADEVLDRLRRAYREGARGERQRRLLEEAIAANERLIARLDDNVRKLEEFRSERVTKGERMRASAVQLGGPSPSTAAPLMAAAPPRT